MVLQYFRRTCMEMQSKRFRGMSCAIIFRTRLAANLTLDIGRSCMLSHDVTPPGNSVSTYQQMLVLEHSDGTPWKINMESRNTPLGKGGFHQPKLTNYHFWGSKCDFSGVYQIIIHDFFPPTEYQPFAPSQRYHALGTTLRFR